jgi:DNA-binding CsgD family transcriptional regulator
MAHLVGREGEVATIASTLERARSRLAVLRIEGEPGIGKSELILAGIERAQSLGFRILQSRPSPAEARLAFGSLSDLLEPVVDEAIDQLPEPQRVAIESALLRRSLDGARVPPRAAAAGTLAILAHAAQTSPLLIAVDDVQWLDAASATAMAFAFRRLGEDRAAILLAQRTSKDPVDRLEDVNTLGPERVNRMSVGPLSLSATYHVLRAHDLAPPSRPALRRIHSASGGNPLYAIELTRATANRTEPAAHDPLPLPESISTLLSRRIAVYGPEARNAMLAVALAGAPSDEVLRSLDSGSAEHDHALVADGILDRQHGRLSFTHPLLAEVAAATFDAAERRRMHRWLAQVVHEPERRARHLALGADGPDATVAAELDAAAAVAARSSAEVACELLELAIAATPQTTQDLRQERSIELSRLLVRAGDTRGAIRILDELLAEAGARRFRARALELRAEIDWVAGRLADAVERCDEALSLPDLDQWTRARLAVTRARLTLDPLEAERLARLALAELDRLPEPDPAMRGEALTALAGAQTYTLGTIDPAIVEEGLRLEAEAPPAAVADRFSAALGAYLKYQGRFEEAREWLRRTKGAAIAEGDEGSLPYALSHLPQLELWTGDWTAAHEAAREHLAVAEWTGQEEQRLTAIHSLAVVDAHAGRLEQARSRIAENLAAAERLDDWNVYQLLSVLGFVELAAGRPGEALPPLRRAHGIYEAYGAGDAVAVHENLAEALVESGDLAEAEQMIDTYVDRAKRLGRPMALAASHRGLALLRAAQKRMPEALAATHVALGHEQEAGVPFNRARTLLVAGRVRRRAGERRAARAALQEALDVFNRLGAPTWAQTASVELGRVPARPSMEPGELTPTERRVAELVGRGLTNREVAGELFVTPKTVEANLTRVYAKLAIRSRAELAAMMRNGERLLPEL